MIKILIVVVITLANMNTALSGVFKCENENGRFSYQNLPCQQNEVSIAIDVLSNKLDTVVKISEFEIYGLKLGMSRELTLTTLKQQGFAKSQEAYGGLGYLKDKGGVYAIIVARFDGDVLNYIRFNSNLHYFKTSEDAVNYFKSTFGESVSIKRRESKNSDQYKYVIADLWDDAGRLKLSIRANIKPVRNSYLGYVWSQKLKSKN